MHKKRLLILAIFLTVVLANIIYLPSVKALTLNMDLNKKVYKSGEIITGNVTLFLYQEDIVSENSRLILAVENIISNISLTNFIVSSGSCKNFTFGNYTFNSGCADTVLEYTKNLSYFLPNFTAPSLDGNYNITINLSSGSEGEVISSSSQSFLSDNSPPNITSHYPASKVTASSAILNVITDETATCKYSSTSGVDYASMNETFNITGDVNHSKILTELQDSSVYSFYIKCNDSVGNAAIADYNITFSVGIPLVMLAYSPSGYIFDSSPKIKFTTDKITICRYSDKNKEYIYMDGLDSTNSTAHSKSLKDLVNKKYTYYIKCRDLHDNEASFEIHFEIDTESPLITLNSPEGGSIFNEKYFIFNYTPRDNSGISKCRLYTNLFGSWSFKNIDVSVANNKSQIFKITSASNKYIYDGEYGWKVECTDNAGNSAFSEEQSFTLDTISKEFSKPNYTEELTVNKIEETENKIGESMKTVEEVKQRTNFITGFSTMHGITGNATNPIIILITIVTILILLTISYYGEIIFSSGANNHNLKFQERGIKWRR